MSPTQENKPPIPTGAGAKKAMEAYFAGSNHMEFRQRSSSVTRSTRSFSRGATPSRDAANVANAGASGAAPSIPEGAIDPDALKSALKKIPSLEKISIRPTPPRSRSISRHHSPLPDEELLDESLPDFYKVTLKPTERTGSQTRDILLGGNRLSHGATPSKDSSVPEFRRMALRRTPSREQLADDQAHRQSTLKKSTTTTAAASEEASTLTVTSLSRSSSYTSLTAINRSVLSRRNSTASEEQKPEFKGFVLKKTGSKPGSRAGSPTKKAGSRGDLTDGVALKKVESKSSSRRGSYSSSEAATEFSNVSLRKTQMVKGDQSKFEVEQFSLKPIPVGEGEEATVGTATAAASSSSSAEIRKQERASSVTRQRVLRETKFEGGDDEYSDIQSSLDKLKKKDSSAVETDSKKQQQHPEEDPAAKPIVYRRRRKQSDEEEAEKIHLKPIPKADKKQNEEEEEKVNLKPIAKRQSFTSSIECLAKAVENEVDVALVQRPTNLLRRMSFTSSLDNIAVEDNKPMEKVHLSCFSKEMGSNVDLVQVCQEKEGEKHEVKLEFEIEGKRVKEAKRAEEELVKEVAREVAKEVEEEEEEEEEEEVVVVVKEVTKQVAVAEEELVKTVANEVAAQVDDETGERLKANANTEEEEGKLHKIRKAPSIDGLFQRQDVQAAFTFTLPFQNDEPKTKLSLEIPNLS